MEAKIFLLLLIVTMEIVSGCDSRGARLRQRQRRREREKRNRRMHRTLIAPSTSSDINGTRHMPVPEDVQTGVISETAKRNMARGAVLPLPTPKKPIIQGGDSEKSLGPITWNSHWKFCQHHACYPQPYYLKPKEPVPMQEPLPGGAMQGGDQVEMPPTTTLRPMSNPILNEAVRMAMSHSIGGPLQVSEVALVNQPKVETQFHPKTQ